MQQCKLDAEKHTAVSSHTNYRYLRTPQRKANLRAEVKTKRNEVERLKLRLKEATEKTGVCVEKQLEDDLQTIMLEKTKEISQKYAENSFHRPFWDQQLEALKVRDKRQVRWHPMVSQFKTTFICLLQCTQIVRSPCVAELTTPRDYTHFVKSKPGFNPGIDEQLCREAKIDSIPEFQKYVCLVFDEIKVKEDLLYDKHSASLLGFVKIGDVNDHLSK